MYKFEAPKDGYIEIKNWRIQLWSRSEGPWATLTINNSAADPENDIFVIKDYSENYGVYDWMKNNDFIIETLDTAPYGDWMIELCKLDVNKIKNYGEEKEKE